MKRPIMEEPFAPEARPRFAPTGHMAESVPAIRGRLSGDDVSPAPQGIHLSFLNLARSCRSSHELLDAAAAFFSQYSGCQAIGIRLAEGDGFPYREARGFSPEFLASESDICTRDSTGRPRRDGRKKPLYQCLCGAMAIGRCGLI